MRAPGGERGGVLVQRVPLRGCVLCRGSSLPPAFLQQVSPLLLAPLCFCSFFFWCSVYLEGLRPYLARWQPTVDDFLASLLRSLVCAGAGAARKFSGMAAR